MLECNVHFKTDIFLIFLPGWLRRVLAGDFLYIFADYDVAWMHIHFYFFYRPCCYPLS